MKNLLKYSIVAAATMTLAGSVYAIPTLVISDGNGTDTIVTDPSGVVNFTTKTFDGDWSVVIASGTATPPAAGVGITASNPTMDLSITATYIGGSGSSSGGNPLTISFGSDNFGPTEGTATAVLTGHMISGPGSPIVFTTIAASGSVLPTLLHPVISGTTLTSATINGPTYFSVLSGPLDLLSYSLDDVVTITGTVGDSYSIDASISVTTSVPDGGMTLVLLGSALSGLALIKRKLA